MKLPSSRENSNRTRRIALILGMHRSGTSLLANILSKLGLDLGTDLMAADEWNEDGYWERKGILEIHEKILKALNLSWDDPRFALPLSSGWNGRSEIQKYRNELAEAVRVEVERTNGVCAFKDPRMAILFPIWGDVIDELELDPVILLAVRRPEAVAASLLKRNNLSPSHAQLLWLKTNLDALSYSGEKLRAIVDYDLWFQNGQEQAESLLAALDLPWRVSPERLAEVLGAVVQPRLRHNDEADGIPCSPLVEKLYAALARGALTGSISEEVEEIRRKVVDGSEFVSLWSGFIAEKEHDLKSREEKIHGLQKLSKQGSFSVQPAGEEWTSFPALPLKDNDRADGKPRLKVCIVSPEFIGPYRNGGIGTACTSLGQALAAAGHEVTLLYTRGRYCENLSIEFWESHYAKEGVAFVPLPNGSAEFVVTAPWYLVTAARVYEWLRERNFDVVHFTEMMGVGYYCVLAKKHGLDFRNTVLCTGTHSPTLWIREANREIVGQADDLGLDYIERKSVALADVVWSPSHYLLNWMQRNKWTLPDACFVQQYILPYSARSASSGASDGPHDVKEIVFFGRLETRKGVVVFCDALDRLCEEPAMQGITVSFLGRNAEVMGRPSEQFIRERATKWPFSWQIMSDFDQPQAIHYLQQPGRVALMASPVDNSPNTVLECLGGRIPFLASRTGGIPELIAPEDEKEICFDWSSDDLARKLRNVCNYGIRAARPAVDIEANEKSWVAWHENLLPLSGEDAREKVFSIDSAPLVSICLSHRDSPAFLEQTIQSIKSQDYSEIELVLADYGSSADESLSLIVHLESVSFRNRHIKVCKSYREGDALNLAAKKAKGKYLLLMSTAVLLKEGSVSSLLTAAEMGGADILTSPADIFSKNGNTSIPPTSCRRWLPLGGSLPYGLLGNCFGISNILIRREVFLASGGFVTSAGSGLDIPNFLVETQLAGAKLEVVPKDLFWYRQEDDESEVDYQSRESLLRTAWTCERSLPDGFTGIPLFSQGQSLKKSREIEEIVRYYEQVIPIMIQKGTAKTLVQLKQFEPATKMLLEAVKGIMSIQNQAFVLNALMEIAGILLEAGQHVLSISLLYKAEQVAQKLNDPQLVRKIQNCIATLSAKVQTVHSSQNARTSCGREV